MAQTSQDKLLSLQYVRALAALAVVVFHCYATRGLVFAPDPRVTEGLRVVAAAAVDIFFILSGFVMVYTQQRANRAAGDFMVQRLARIVPLYWFSTMLLVLVLFIGNLAGTGLHGALHQLGQTRNFIGSSLLFASHFLHYPYPVLLPGWSLEYEILFYAIFALAIRFGGRAHVAVAMAALALLCLSGLLRLLCLEFAAGCLVALLYQRGWHVKAAMALVPLAPLVVTLGVLRGAYAFVNSDDLYRLAYCGVPMLGLFLAALTLSAGRHPRLLLLGDASYSIYVGHCLWLYLFTRLFPAPASTLAGATAAAAAFGMAVAGGIALHLWVERPSARLLQRWLGDGKPGAGRTGKAKHKPPLPNVSRPHIGAPLPGKPGCSPIAQR